MAGFGFSLPKLPTQALAGDPATGGGAPDLTMADRLMMVGAVLKGHPDLAMQVPLMAQARRAFAAQQAATGDLANAVSGKAIPQRPAALQYTPPVDDAEPASPAVNVTRDLGAQTGLDDAPPVLGQRRPISVAPAAVPMRDPAADLQGQGPPSVRAALPMLAKLARTGGNIEPWTKLLDAAQPKALQVNGRVLDEHDPSIYGGYYGEAPTKGAEPVYDGNGRQVGWHMADGAIQAIADVAKASAGATKAGELPYAGPTAEATSAGTARGKAPYELVTKDVNGAPVTMTQQQAIDLANGGAPAAAKPGVAPATGAALPVVGGKLDPQGFYKSFVLRHEGGLNPSDLNGSPTMYGFNQKANPDIDVSKLTPDTAAARFEQKYYAPSGAANLPPALGAVHADTYFINPKAAQSFLQQSGGDPSKYMDLRESWLNHLVQTQPGAAKYAQAWSNRNADLRALTQQAAAGLPETATAAAPGFHGVNEADKKTVAGYVEDAKTAEDVAQKAHQFQELNKKTFTGPVFNPVRVHIPLVGDVPLNPISGIGSAFQPGSQAMDNLSMQMASGLRVPGQRLTQAEIFQNLKTVPRRGSLPASNDTSADVIDTRAATKRAYANAASDWLTKNGTLNGFDADWARQQAKGSSGASGSPTAASPVKKAQPMQQIRLKSGGVATVVPVG